MKNRVSEAGRTSRSFETSNNWVSYLEWLGVEVEQPRRASQETEGRN